MPTATEYHDAAGRYRAISENLFREAGAVGGWVPSFISQGLVADRIEASIGRSRIHLEAAGEDLRRLAGVCEARADVCAQFAAAVLRYRRLSFAERVLSGYPARPAVWVEM